MTAKIIFKIMSLFLLVFLAITTPWWVTILASVFFLFATASYASAVLAGLTIDILYGTRNLSLTAYKFTLLATVLCLAVFYLKRRLIFYPDRQ